MTRKPPPPIHFPSARDKGAFPFPTARSMARRTAEPPAEQPDEQLSAEDLRLMADTMPGEGPGD
jgi:hypothetical protein